MYTPNIRSIMPCDDRREALIPPPYIIRGVFRCLRVVIHHQSVVSNMNHNLRQQFTYPVNKTRQETPFKNKFFVNSLFFICFLTSTTRRCKIYIRLKNDLMQSCLKVWNKEYYSIFQSSFLSKKTQTNVHPPPSKSMSQNAGIA